MLQLFNRAQQHNLEKESEEESFKTSEQQEELREAECHYTS